MAAWRNRVMPLFFIYTAEPLLSRYTSDASIVVFWKDLSYVHSRRQRLRALSRRRSADDARSDPLLPRPSARLGRGKGSPPGPHLSLPRFSKRAGLRQQDRRPGRGPEPSSRHLSLVGDGPRADLDPQ